MCKHILYLAVFGIFLFPSSVYPDVDKNNTISRNTLVFNYWFTQDKYKKWQGKLHQDVLFTWFSATTTADDENSYNILINLQKENGVKYLGYYYSAVTAIPQETIRKQGFPERAIPHSAIKPAWILKDAKGLPITWPGDAHRYYLNIGLQEVREAIVNRAVQHALRSRLNVLYLDNWSYKWGPPDKSIDREQWSQHNLLLLKKVREITQKYNIKLVINQVAPFESWHEFAPYVDGIAYEMSTHPTRLKSKELYKLELDTYEKILAQQKSVFLYPGMLKDGEKRWDEDGRKVALTALLVMPKDQPLWGGIYVANPYYEVWPAEWYFWTYHLGRPINKRNWVGNKVFRDFEKGTVSVEVGSSHAFEINMKF